jgi:hypothetical protein
MAAAWGLALAALLLVPQSTAHAQGSGIFGPPGMTAVVMGAWYDTGATIHAAVPADAGVHNIEISDRRRLHAEMYVKVDSEEMWITALSGDPSPVWNAASPDVMTVNRAQNGTTVAAHSVGAKVNAKVATVSIMVNNLTTPEADCDQDEEFYAYATLKEDIDETQTLVRINTAPQAFLSDGLDIRIGFEEMRIVHLYDYPSGPDPRMDVTRGVNGTTAAEHSQGSDIWGKKANPTPRQQCGLGAYRIDLHYNPSNARYISLVNGSFLGSTGRTVYDATGTCFTPDTSVSGRVRMECNTTDLGKFGALGSGLLATALFEPLTTGYNISNLTMDGSFLTDIMGTVLSGVSVTNGFLQSTPHAQGSGSFGPPGMTAAVMGAWYDTGATIKVAVPADAGYQNIQISDRRRLHVDMYVKVDSEEMWITALSGPTDPVWNAGNPDIMTVNRGQNGTTVAAHGVGVKVNAKVARVDIMVNNLTTDVLDCQWSYSGADLAQDMDVGQTSVQITQVGLLTNGLNIRIDSEEMTITGLNPSVPTMQVMRAQNGTTAASHYAGTPVYGKTTNPTPTQQCGLGAYRIDLYYNPSNVRYISLVNGSFLGSTGRTVYDATGHCFTPDTSVSGRVRIECNSTGVSGGKPIIGALGSGLLATALFEPLTIGTSISNLTMNGSFLTDITGSVLSGVEAKGGTLQAMTCPDANGDAWVNITDVYLIARSLNDRGTDSGATIAEAVDSSQTTIQISGLGTLAVNDIVAVDFEQMRVNSLGSGPPATMQVQRAVNQTSARAHQTIGAIVYVASWDGNSDGTKGYTEPKDVNPRVFGGTPDKTLPLPDIYTAARIALGGVSVTCQYVPYVP